MQNDRSEIVIMVTLQPVFNAMSVQVYPVTLEYFMKASEKW